MHVSLGLPIACSVLVLAAFNGSCQAAAPLAYRATQLITTPGTTSSAAGLNDLGHVVGYLTHGEPGPWSAAQAFVYADSTRTIAPLPGDNANAAVSINNAGVVVGTSRYAAPRSYSNRAFVHDGTLSDAGTSAYFATDPADINQLGQVVGAYHRDGSSYPQWSTAFLYAGGAMTELGTLGGAFSAAGAINDSGQIVGTSSLANHFTYRAFTWQNGAMRALGTLGGSGSQASDINNRGQIVGSADIAGDAAQHAFLYDNGVMTDLGNIGLLAGTRSHALSINDSGDVIGYADQLTGDRLFFLYSGGAVYDIAALLGDPAWEIEGIAGINAQGQIALTAFKAGLGRQALRLDPVSLVPEPEYSTMLLAGLGLVGFAARRKA